MSTLSSVAIVNIVTANDLYGGWITLTLWITGFLFLLNIGLAVFFRRRRKLEVVSYYIAAAFELAIFVFALLVKLNIITEAPYPLPPGLPIGRASIGAALAFGLGLFPAALWHRVNVSDLPKRLAEDAKQMNEREARVHVRRSTPGEWMN